MTIEHRDSVPRWRSALDVVCTLTLIATCGAVMWAIFSAPQRRAVGPAPRAAVAGAAQGGASLPPEPVALGATGTRGSRAARVAMIVYSDFQCPFCGKFERDTLPLLAKRYIDSGKVILDFRQFPLGIHPFAQKAAEAVECAGREGKFWPMHDLLFQHQTELSEPSLNGFAAHVGLKPDGFRTCLAGQMSSKVNADADSGRALAVTGTPTFFIGRVQGDGRVKLVQRLTGAQPVTEFEAALDRTLNETTVAAR
jgi:protein-disulfide isomerase